MKTLSELQGCWKLSVFSFLVISGGITLTGCFAISFAGALWAIASSGDYALAQQIVGDNTLGDKSSQVTSPIPGDFQIDGGATRGTNLFHSFSEFSVPSNGIVYFNNAQNIGNIISRVTGGSVSNIDGLIAANGTANLFLLNPNGIIFGPNAKLDIGGSFVGSTASSLNLADGSQFSATATKTTPLLTISVPLGLQYGANAGSIQVQASTLQVPNGKTLALVGGNITLDGASLQAPGGHVQLGGVAGTATVGLSINGNNLRLSFSDGVALSDVSLIDEAEVNVLAGGGGSIAINAQNLNMAGESRLLAGIASGLGFSGSRTGDIEIKVTGALNLTDGSAIANLVLEEGVGKGGDINITTGQLLVQNGSQVLTDTSGTGDGGNLIVKASQGVQVMGTTSDGRLPSALYALTQGTGAAGNLEITTQQLLIFDKAQIGAGTLGPGNGGNLKVNASQGVQVIGSSADGQLRSGLLAQTEGTGAAGNLEITTKQLLVSNGGVISSSSLGSGNAGDLIVNASEKVQLIGTTPDGQLPNGLFASTIGTGAAGNLEIRTQQLLLQDGAQIGTGTFGSGNGGNLIVNASDSVLLIGTALNGKFSSGLFARTEGIGQAGNLEITTRHLLVSDGAQVSVSTFGKENGGRLIVNASEKVQLIGTSADGLGASGLFARTEGTGEAGDLEIITRQLLVQNGAQISVSTISSGNGGNLIVNASEKVQLIGTSADGQLPSSLLAITSSNSTGNGGSITINTNNLDLANGVRISAQSEGSGKAGGITINAFQSLNLNNGEISATAALSDAGNINISASSIRLDNRATISADTKGEQGNINLNSVDLVLRHGSNITTNAQGSSVIGGNITIDTGVLAALENSDVSANSANFRGGNVTITAQGIFGTQFRLAPTPESDITATGADSSLNGTVTINSPDVDPSRGLVNLPSEPVNVEVAQGCQTGGKQSSIEFFNTGRGGLAPNPYEPLSSNDIWEDVPPSTQKTENFASADHVSASPATLPDKMVEAQGWLVNEKGEVVLVAEVPATRSQGRCRLR